MSSELEILKQLSWNLHYAVTYILNGTEKEVYKDIKDFGCIVISKKHSPIYKILIKAIENNELKPSRTFDILVATEEQIKEIERAVEMERAIKFSQIGLSSTTYRNNQRLTHPAFSSDELKKKYKQKTYFVNQKELIKVCLAKGIPINPDLNKYFDSRYWLDRKFWTFDEFVIFLSEELPPFPHEITNVFNDDRYYELAVKIRKYLAGKPHITYHPINGKIKLIEFDPRVHDINKCLIAQIPILTTIGKDTELFSMIKNQRLKTEINQYMALHKFAEEVRSTTIAKRRTAYKEKLTEIAKKFDLFKKFPNDYSEELNPMLDRITGFGDYEEKWSILVGYDKFLNHIYPFDEKVEQTSLLGSNFEKLHNPLSNNSASHGIGLIASMSSWVREDLPESHDEEEETNLNFAAEKATDEKNNVIKKRCPPKTHRICIMALTILKEEGLCDLEESESHLWNMIIKICNSQLELKQEHLKTLEEKKLTKIRKDIKNKLALHELTTNRDSTESNYYICFQDTQSKRPRKERKRKENDYIEFRFATFCKEFSEFKSKVLAKS